MLARRFSTLDHLTGGRIGWNIVTGIWTAPQRTLVCRDSRSTTPAMTLRKNTCRSSTSCGRALGSWGGASDWDREHLIPDPKPPLPPRLHDAHARGRLPMAAVAPAASAGLQYPRNRIGRVSRNFHLWADLQFRSVWSPASQSELIQVGPARSTKAFILSLIGLGDSRLAPLLAKIGRMRRADAMKRRGVDRSGPIGAPGVLLPRHRRAGRVRLHEEVARLASNGRR